VSAEPGGFERILRRDSTLVVSGVAALTLTAWGYLLLAAGEMGRLDEGAGGAVRAFYEAVMPGTGTWGGVDLLLLFLMWAIMMVAMMTPSAAPLVLTFDRARRRRGRGGSFAWTGFLLSGYLLVWVGFSGLATLAQWGLHEAALLSPMMVSSSAVLGGGLLVAAGVFQLTPLKRACLVRCRSPLSFLMSEWRRGRWGAFVMGWKHGAYCVGCCWLLMALLFVGGVMNLVWVAVLAAFVLVERVAPGGELIGSVAGVLLIGWGALLLSGFAVG
jgi:predicted metal-binding membrane protein